MSDVKQYSAEEIREVAKWWGVTEADLVAFHTRAAQAAAAAEREEILTIVAQIWNGRRSSSMDGPAERWTGPAVCNAIRARGAGPKTYRGRR